jgi:hypothetical protein
LLGNDCEISNYTTAVVRQWLSSDHVDTNATTALKQKDSVFCVVRAEML